MAKVGKLRAALDAHQARDIQAERQKKLQKEARRRKRQREAGSKENGMDGDDGTRTKGDDGAWSGIEDGEGGEQEKIIAKDIDVNGDQSEGSGSEEEPFGGIDISHIDDTDSDSELEDDVEDEEDVPALVSTGHGSKNGESRGHNSEDEDDNEEQENDHDLDVADDDEDIPLSELSELSSTAKEDIIPHQRLTINNTSALRKALRSIALPVASMAFSEHQTLTSDEPVAIADVNDDLNRELAFYKQSLDAVRRARTLLRDEGLPFSRPTDYFAEMVKSDEHMGRIKQRLVDEAANKKAAAEARKQRDLKKFGKQVQVARLQERDRAKRDTLDRIQMLKKKRKNAPTADGVYENENADADMFDVGLEDKPNKRARHQPPLSGGAAGNRNNKVGLNAQRQQRDRKFGFGGKKRFGKSGDAISSGDLSGFNKGAREKGGRAGPAGKKPGRMGKPGGGVAKKRLGKSRRVKVR